MTSFVLSVRRRRKKLLLDLVVLVDTGVSGVMSISAVRASTGMGGTELFHFEVDLARRVHWVELSSVDILDFEEILRRAAFEGVLSKLPKDGTLFTLDRVVSGDSILSFKTSILLFSSVQYVVSSIIELTLRVTLFGEPDDVKKADLDRKSGDARGFFPEGFVKGICVCVKVLQVFVVAKEPVVNKVGLDKRWLSRFCCSALSCIIR